MDHVVYLDSSSRELEKIMDGSKTMILRGGAGRKTPYGAVETGDCLYFINKNSSGEIQARAKVKSVYNSEKLTPEAALYLVEENEKSLQLSKKQKENLPGKRYLVLIEIESPENIQPFSISKTGMMGLEEWLLVGNIQNMTVAVNY